VCLGNCCLLVVSTAGVQVIGELDDKVNLTSVPFSSVTKLETDLAAEKWSAQLLADAAHWLECGESLGDGGVAGSTVSLPT
jgi:hypothetical protein